jgi:hypothetical protein
MSPENIATEIRERVSWLSGLDTYYVDVEQGILEFSGEVLMG